MPLDLEDISVFLKEGVAPEGMKALERKKPAIRATPYMLISGGLYKLGHDKVLRRCVLEHEFLTIIEEAHRGSAGGHYACDTSTHKILMEGLWWENLYKDCKEYCTTCYHCQCIGKPRNRYDIPLCPIPSDECFEKWSIEFVGPIAPATHRTRSHYVITCMDYLIRWEKEAPTKDFTTATIEIFFWENIITMYGCPLILTNDRSINFLNETVRIVLAKFMVSHHKTTPYHPQENGTTKSFNKILSHNLTKIFDVGRQDWDDKVSAILWAYMTTYKRMNKATPFQLVFGTEVVLPVEFMLPSLRIAHVGGLASHQPKV